MKIAILNRSPRKENTAAMVEAFKLDSGTLAPLLKRLEKQVLVSRVRPENNERKLFLSLTEQGLALREKALAVPTAMQGCLDLEPEDMLLLKKLLDKALVRMDRK